ncbi:Dihydrolipoamide acetyltransferase family protein / 2-oxo acid dehydrogenase subunit E2 [[Mycoplasma] cavipharyngis]|uniref:dihydrolipoamide acetyltransferase family protein n=1 Tax=[Mycoplasma] cavipharyngis TaxID=92757 RepID=UPI0037042199
MYYFKFADIGEGLHEGKVTKILVKVGDTVKDGEPLFEVETDKVTSEITAPISGKIHEIKITVDQTIHVGEVAFIIDDGSNSQTDDQAIEAKTSSEQLKSQSVQQQKIMTITQETNTTASDLATNVSQQALTSDFSQIKISSLARKIALAEAIDLTNIKGTGPQNRIIVADLKRSELVIEKPVITETVASKQIIKSEPLVTLNKTFSRTRQMTKERQKVTSVQIANGLNWKNSWENVAYVTQVVEVDVTNLLALIAKHQKIVKMRTGIELNNLAFVAKATSLALLDFPIFTSTYDSKTQELVYPETLNLGIAVESPNGLIVPNIKNAQTLSVYQLNQKIEQFKIQAQNQQLSEDSMVNGHFTITDYSCYHAIFGVPIVKFPEIAILAVGSVFHRFGHDQKEHYYIYLTVGADHRFVDGATIANFATRIKNYLENPFLLAVF